MKSKKNICKYIIRAGFLLLIISSFFSFIGCSRNQLSYVRKNMSDERCLFFDGQSQSFFCVLESGEREIEYDFDGESKEKIEFSLLSLIPKSNIALSEIPTKVLIDNSCELVTLIKSPFENLFVIEIPSKIDKDMEVKVQIPGEDEIELVCQSVNWKTDSNKAIEIGFEFLKQDFSKDKFEGECYLKVVFDKSKEIKYFFWQFSYLSKNGKSGSVIIEPETGKILVKL